MDKETFLHQLQRRLAYLPISETAKPIAFYAECIDDRMEDGMTEEEAVAALGSLDEIVREIEGSLPLGTVVRERVRADQAKRGGGWILLAVLGSPIWVPLLIAALAVVLGVYIALWGCLIGVYAVWGTLAFTGVVLLVYGAARCFTLGLYASFMVFGLACILLGGFLLLWRPCLSLAKLLWRLTRRFGRWLKTRILKGGRKA